jgi:hypothetical protein
MTAGDPSDTRPSVTVAVVVEREAQPNRWEDWRFRVVEVLPDEAAFGREPRLLRDDGKTARWLHPGFTVALYRDECEGYHLNLVSRAPVWFVMWRIGETDPPVATPEVVSVSYNEAGRWLDAQERVDNLPLTPEVAAWLSAYTTEHYRPEVKQRRRPASFKPAEQR